MALLIPVLRGNYASLEGALNKYAPYDWTNRRLIHLFPIDDSAQPQFNNLVEYCQNNSIKHILVPKRLHCGEANLRDAGYTVIMGPGISELTQGLELPRQLRMLGLDWRSNALARLANYGLGTVTEDAMNAWLAQFERLANHRTVGEHLLQLLDVISLTELGDSLCTDSDFYGADLVVGFSKGEDAWGKSWSTISNLIRKKCDSAQLLPITEAIQAGEHPQRVLRLVEDGLFSGTEIRGVFDSLRGTRREGRSQKVPKLEDPGLLLRMPVRLHFGVICDFGEAVIRQYMALNSLPNVQVVVSAAAKKLRVLHGPSETQANNPSFKDDLISRVVPFAFQSDKGWITPALSKRARTFCENVGEQLWRNYITKKNFGGEIWPESRIRLCSLGMDGLGLTLAFPHSVPKASLPVFWAEGPVSLGGSHITWTPLLPNSNT